MPFRRSFKASQPKRKSCPPAIGERRDPALTLDLSGLRSKERRFSLMVKPQQDEDTPQVQMYLMWWNHWLSERQLESIDLTEHRMRSGILPIVLAEILTGETAAVHHPDPQSEQEQRENQLAAMALLRAARIPLVSANGSTRNLNALAVPEAVDEYASMATHLQQGSLAAVCSLTWSLILHVDVGVGSRPDGSKAALNELLTWARDTTDGYAGVSIGRTRYAWSEAFGDGMAWCALVDAHDSTLLDLGKVSAMEEPEERLLALFQMAEEQLDVPTLCDASAPVDDPRVAITFTAQLRNALHARQMFAEQSSLESTRAAAEAEQREQEEQRRQQRAEQQLLLEQQQRQAAQELALQQHEEAAARTEDEEPPLEGFDRVARASTGTVESFDRVASSLASGRESVPVVESERGSVALDMSAVEAEAEPRPSASRHSMAWQLRRRRESLNGKAYSSPSKKAEAAQRQSAFPYPLPRSSSRNSDMPTTPRSAAAFLAV